MITFKQFLSEKALNQSTYSAVIAKYGSTALLGLELEVWLPSGSKHHVGKDDDIERESVNISGFNKMSDFDAVFNMSGRDQSRIADDYAEWVTKQQDLWVEDTWEQYVDADEEEQSPARAEKNARKEAASSFKSTSPKYSWKTWYLETYDDPYKFIGEYNLEPTYGWQYENGDESEVYSSDAAEPAEGAAWENSAENFALALEDLLSVQVDVKKEPGGKVTKWKIVPDTSIVPDGQEDADQDHEGVGMEIVSPPIPVSEGIVALKKICDWLDSQGAVTNESTGIHINLSIPGLATKLDPLKLVLFMGDEHILAKFNRLKNTFAIPVTRDILDGIQKRGKIPNDGVTLMDYARSGLNTGAKYRTVNLQHLEQGYLEFRAAGNAGYHKRYEDLVEAIGRWLTVIDLACDPDRERKEYMKKVALLLGKTPESKASQKLGDLDVEGLINTSSFGEMVGPAVWGTVKKALAGNPQDQAAAPLDIAILLGRNLTYKPTFAQRVGMTKLINQLGSSESKIRSSAKSASSRDRESVERFLNTFKLPKK